MVQVIEPLPDAGASYDRFKRAVMDTIPHLPKFITRQLEHELVSIGITSVKWRAEPVRRRSDNQRDYWFLLGEGEFHGVAVDAANQALLRLGNKYHGWVPGCNWGCGGWDTWVVNFTIAALAL
jgi:hypothetical protein